MSVEIDLHIGAQVYWTDPDEGVSSGFYRIERMNINEGDDPHPNTILVLSNEAGSEVEAFLHECS